MCSRDDVFHCFSHYSWIHQHNDTRARYQMIHTHTLRVHWYDFICSLVLAYVNVFAFVFCGRTFCVICMCSMNFVQCFSFSIFLFFSLSNYHFFFLFFLLNTFRLLSSPFIYLFSFCFIKLLFFSLFSWFSLSLSSVQIAKLRFFLGKLQYCDTKETEANKLIMHTTLSFSYTNTHEAQGRESAWFIPSWTIERTQKKPKVIQTWLAYFYIKFTVVDWITKIIKCKIC